jgi:S-adenosylmethionine-diacylgycerolhomoserine-N-methlytransferase
MAGSMSLNTGLETAVTPASDRGASMDRMYRYQRHIYDVTRAYYLLGRNQMIANLAPPPGGLVLEVGCGTGRNIVQAASRYRQSGFVGIDISTEMLKSAQLAVQRRGLVGRVSLLQADAVALGRDIARPRQGFDRIYFSYTLSMIPAWQKAIESAVDFLGPSGRIHIVDFGEGEGLPGSCVGLLRKWLHAFGVHPRDGLGDVLGQTAKKMGMTLDVKSSHRGYAVHATLKKET